MDESFEPFRGKTQPPRHVVPALIVAGASQRIDELRRVVPFRIGEWPSDRNPLNLSAPQPFVIIKQSHTAVPFLGSIQIFDQTQYIPRRTPRSEKYEIDQFP